MTDKTSTAIWRVTYKDGTTLWESDPKTRKESLFKDIQLNNIRTFEMLIPVNGLKDLLAEEVVVQVRNLRGQLTEVSFKTYHNEVLPIFKLELDDNQRLIFYKRVKKSSGQHVAVFGDPNMLDPDKRRAEEERLSGEGKSISIKPPQTIPYPIEKGEERILIIGWQRTIGGENVKSICFIYPDGRVEMKNDR